jgi:AcrR family transcriptional regulator
MVETLLTENAGERNRIDPQSMSGHRRCRGRSVKPMKVPRADLSRDSGSDLRPSLRDAARPRLLATASALLEAEGLEAVQARRVAAAAGCSVGTLYNVFGDIDGLIIAINEETLGLLGGAVASASSTGDDLEIEQRLRALALIYMRFALDNRRRWEAVFKYRRPEGSDLPTTYVEGRARLLGTIEQALGRTVSDPNRRAAAARALFGAVHGIVSLALDDRLGGQPLAELETQLAFMTELAARGLEAGASPRLPGTDAAQPSDLASGSAT